MRMELSLYTICAMRNLTAICVNSDTKSLKIKRKSPQKMLAEVNSPWYTNYKKEGKENEG
jgi:hypothetical protein